MLKMTGVKLEQISDTDKYLFVKKGLKGGDFILLRVMLKQIINTWMIMTLKNCQNLYVTLIWTICMVGDWVNIFLMADLSGKKCQ